MRHLEAVAALPIRSCTPFRVGGTTMRALLAAVAVLALLAGCAGPRLPTPPERPGHRQLVVLVDHFHGVLAVPADDLDEDLRAPLAALPGAWITFHFGEQRWMTDLSTGSGHAASLFFGGGPGLIEQDRLPRLGEDELAYVGFAPERVRAWTFSLDERAWAAWQARPRRRWLAGGGMPPPLPGPTVFLFTAERWTVANNCHDFVLDLVRAGGVPVAVRPLVGAKQAAIDLDRAAVAFAPAP